MSGPARTCNLLLLASCGHRSFVGQEVCSVGQHAVQNDGEFAGDRDLRLAHAGASGQADPPALQRGALHRSGQDNVSRLLECGAHAAVSDLENATGDIGLARLVLLGRQSEMRPYGLG